MIRFIRGTGATGVLLAAIACATVLLFVPQPAEPAVAVSLGYLAGDVLEVLEYNTLP